MAKKYIDAERLRAEIERRLDELNPKTGMFGDRPLRAVNPKTFPRESELEKVLYFIDSLQQEQPEEVCIFKPNMTIDEMKDSLNGKQQEQQECDLGEVDLTEEINRYCGTRDVRPVPDFMETVAYHFYELGRLNARKEE